MPSRALLSRLPACALVLVLLGAGPETPSPQVEVSLKKLDSSQPSERQNGFRELAQRGPGASAAVPRLTQVLRSGSAGGDARHAAEVLGWIRSPEAVPALIEALSASSWRLQWEAATALGRIGSREALPALEALEREHWFTPVRRAAAKARESIGRAGKASRSAPKSQEFMEAHWEGLRAQAVPPEEQCWDAQKQQWRVRMGKRWLTLERPALEPGKLPQGFPEDLLAADLGTHFHRVEEGWLVGLDGGEWGGALWLVTAQGRKTVLAEGENFLGFARTATGLVVFTGRGHLGENMGVAHVLTRAGNGTWTRRLLVELPALPRAWYDDVDGSLVVALNQGGVVALEGEGPPRMLSCR